MSDLSKKKCVACDGDTPPFDTTEIHKYLKKVDGWDVKSDEKKNFYLIKNFSFENFEQSQVFVIEWVKLLRKKTTTLIFLLAGVTAKLRFLHMQ